MSAVEQDPIGQDLDEYLATKTCSIDGCTAAHLARGMCGKHYARWSRHGDPTAVLKVGRPRTNPVERFWSKVDKAGPLPRWAPFLGPCWVWTDALDRDGYGNFGVDGAHLRPHRFAYELLVGPIPDGLVLDHLCRVRRCVNPTHLEPVTPAQNTFRGRALPVINARKTHCVNGHPFDDENTIITASGKRRCRACTRKSNRERMRRLRAGVKA